MATRVLTVDVCDICDKDSEQAEVATHTVALDTKRVEIDLCGDDLARFQKVFDEFESAGRKPRRKQRAVAK